MRLATRPTQQVSVSVSSADSGAVSVPSQPLTFTTQNWRTAQTVTVSGVSDDDAGDETVTVTVTASGGDYAGNTATVTVSVDDDDTTDLVVSRGSLTVDEGDGDGRDFHGEVGDPADSAGVGVGVVGLIRVRCRCRRSR